MRSIDASTPRLIFGCRGDRASHVEVDGAASACGAGPLDDHALASLPWVRVQSAGHLEHAPGPPLDAASLESR